MKSASRGDLDSSQLPLMMHSQRGFSLIALIGILAAISISLAIASPTLVKIFERDRQETERLQLRLIADGIFKYLEQNKAFPPTLTSLVPDYVPFSAAQISINAHGFPRYYAIHPDMLGFDNGAGLLTAELVDARFLLLSNLTQDVAPTITTPAEFESWWTTNESAVPNLFLHRGNIANLLYSLAISTSREWSQLFH